MDRDAVLAAFDEQVRRRPQVDALGGEVERDEHVIRGISRDGGWNGVSWSDLDDRSADAVIAAQISRYAELSVPWEWKHYSYDRPPDLPERLVAAGFTREPDEALLVAETAGLELEPTPPACVELRPVLDADGVDALISVQARVFGGERGTHASLGRSLLAGIQRRPSSAAAVVAWADGEPIAGGRIEFNRGSEFAGLWGGATVAQWRHQGIFRALVAHRAALAAERGFRYLQVDASPDSHPILERLGFVQLAVTTPFTHPGLARVKER